MTVARSGNGEIHYMCDICGEMIGLVLVGYRPYVFEVVGMQDGKTLFHAHKVCKPALMKAVNTKNWLLLPNNSPLKEAYQAACRSRGIKV